MYRNSSIWLGFVLLVIAKRGFIYKVDKKEQMLNHKISVLICSVSSGFDKTGNYMLNGLLLLFLLYYFNAEKIIDILKGIEVCQFIINLSIFLDFNFHLNFSILVKAKIN